MATETARDNKHKREQYRDYNKNKRDPTVRKWQASVRYKNARKYFLKKNPFCVKCAKDKGEYNPSRLVKAEVLDHIVPHKSDYSLFWDQTNWQALCKQCHNRKTNSKDGGFGNPIR
jgi:5-methylcytosine-specific restriction protein A